MFFIDHDFNISFYQYFSEEWEQIYQFNLKSKTTEGNPDAIYFPISYYSVIQKFCYSFIFQVYEA